ncbi:ATP-binding protein [Nocardioides sp. GY 10127]|uniref:ATP-binding protein n=1 Tax=Nocardioides sp. GY 10127 TaxID=2569762 RepID=UPI001458624E|nr:ATP-binding protein [Nocardioides sp. GY 10127]
MPIAGPQLEIIGVTLARCGPVEQVTHLPLDDTVTALYGENGAGKSTLLNLLAMTLQGRSTYPWDQTGPGDSTVVVMDVHTRFLMPVTDGDGVRRDPLRQTLLDALYRREVFPEPDQDLLQLLVERICQAHGRAERDDPTDDLLLGAWREAASERRLTFRAVGSESPSWGVFLACSPASTLGSEALRRTDQTWQHRRSPRSSDPRAFDDRFHPAYWGTDARPCTLAALPRSFQVPSLFLGQVAGMSLADVVHVTTDLPDADEITRAFMLSLEDPVHEELLDESGTALMEDIAEAMRQIETSVNELVSCLQPTWGSLTWDLLTPEDWIRGRLPRWSSESTALEDLSFARRRWAGIAALTALTVHRHEIARQLRLWTGRAERPVPFVLLCDEPEAGLHKNLERHLPTALTRWTQGRDGAAVVATHSAELLASPSVSTMFVSMPEATYDIAVRPVTHALSLVDGTATRRSASDTGLSVGDLLSLSRLTLVVEGIHDEAVFTGLIRDSLDSALAGVLPIHGGTRLGSLADARLVIDGTDAPVLIVLDDLDREQGNDALAQIALAARDDDPVTLRRALEEVRQLGRTNDSMLFLHQFASRAERLGRLDRVRVHGLSLPDVICYLDPDTILSSPRPWPDLIDQWHGEAGPDGPRNIKKWLTRRKLLPQDPKQIDEAVAQAVLTMQVEGRPLHPDLVALGSRIEELGLR